MRKIRGCDANEAGEILRKHIGVCFDTCHVALQFEDPLEALRIYRSEGIRISKVQLSAALMTGSGDDCWNALRPYAEGVYLHQVKARAADGKIRSWIDLPLALEDQKGREGIAPPPCNTQDLEIAPGNRGQSVKLAVADGQVRAGQDVAGRL